MRTLFCIFMTLAPLLLSAQDLEVPRITRVSVDPASGLPVIEWEMDDPQSVDGYIIKRKIAGGQGVVPGTINNVAVLDDSRTFSYTDTSTAYGTQACPALRQEVYTLSSYRVVDGRKYYSLMSPEASTLTVSGRYDPCTREYSFSYSGYDEVGTYVLHTYLPADSRLAVSRDTVMTFTFADHASNRSFAIEAQRGDGVQMYSPVITIGATKPEPPLRMEITGITATDAELMLDVLYSSDPATKTTLTLRRHNLDTHEMAYCDMEGEGPIRHLDSDANPACRYAYRMLASDACGNVLAVSDSVSNMVLQVGDCGSQNANILTWNHLDVQSGNMDGAIFRQVDDGAFGYLAPVARLQTEHLDRLSNLIADADTHSGRVCYYLEMYLPDGQTARSNVACISRDPVLYVPNALNPRSDNMDDRELRPRADFLDDYKLTVFDKRGAVIFVSTDINRGWDGTDRQQRLCHSDTYVYCIEYRTSSGQRRKKTGYVNLVY